MKATPMIIILIATAFILPQVGCVGSSEKNDQWAVSENTTIPMNWDKLMEAYKEAKGPEDFEEKINNSDIYGGAEPISVVVQEKDAKTQEVIGFIDGNKSGSVDDAEGEKVFTIKRVIDGENAYADVAGHGMYASYAASNMLLGMATGFLIGSMIHSAMQPGYRPMSQPYVTNSSRYQQLAQSKSNYVSNNPSKFAKASTTGRSWGQANTAFNRSGNSTASRTPSSQGSSSGSSRSWGGSSSGSGRSGGGSFGRSVAKRRNDD